jgi:hypothetical protein
MNDAATTRPDEANQKGAVEEDTMPSDIRTRPEHTSFGGQLGHRDQNEMLKDNDTDFPEPDAEGEHSGESSSR